jgi:mevalonate kinase
MQHYHSNGKLLLFGEYFVLEGAQSLSIPTHLGQTLSVSTQEFLLEGLNWKSYDHEGNLWLEVFFDSSLDIKHSTDAAMARTLQTILMVAKDLNPNFLKDPAYYTAETRLQFPRNWGLGSSSTLIAGIAQWAQVDAFELFFNSFKGSGYDIACAISDKPVLYRLDEGKPVWKKTDFNPSFSQNISYVYLDKKQNSREGIQLFKQKSSLLSNEVDKISQLTQKALLCNDLGEFMELINQHEAIVAQALELDKVKDLYFADFDGSIKSLGAWGGDFIMAASHLPFNAVKDYFEKKGFATIVAYKEMIGGSYATNTKTYR